MPRKSAREIPATARASVAMADSTSEVRQFELTAPDADNGWLEVTASGICGTDVGIYARGVPEPTVLGHHVVGRIAALGEVAAESWQVEVGDRVVVEEYLPCGRCDTCRTGPYRLCPETDIFSGGRRIGMVPVTEEPGLFGGNAEYLHLPSNAVVHELPSTLSEELAAWVLPYANAIDWTSGAGQLRPDDRVVVLGPGYHGLALVAAALRAGARDVVAVGLSRDGERLAMAESLGATPVVADSADEIGRAVSSATGGHAVDAVFDAVGPDPSVIAVSTALLGQGGRLVLTTPKKPAELAIDTGAMVRKNLRVGAVRGRDPEAIRHAITALGDGSSRLEALPTITVGLDQVGDVLTRLSTGTGPESPHVVVRPGAK